MFQAFMTEAPEPRYIPNDEEPEMEENAAEKKEQEEKALAPKLLDAVMTALMAFPQAFDAAVLAMRVVTGEMQPDPQVT